MLEEKRVKLMLKAFANYLKGHGVKNFQRIHEQTPISLFIQQQSLKKAGFAPEVLNAHPSQHHASQDFDKQICCEMSSLLKNQQA